MTKLEELIPRTSPVVLFCESQIVRTLQIGENEVGEWKSKSDQVGGIDTSDKPCCAIL